ncbi:DNA polymerase III subunit alpha [Candidatus Solirubrobacter pratensis]|uniref:DNA polymerase III subunit alpha n=1 Tax=Candidatus Solirubrobacter pratensis TaxID=1298857 RepID=UPI000418482A|nr:DNA polymerase III subunit alpha [Candidatus Solirubrobacter pratensis]
MIAPLHNHTEYSALDGLATPLEIAQRCQCIGCTAVGITDHGTVAGHLEFDKVMRAHDLKPIFGVELYHGLKYGNVEWAKNERDNGHFIVGAMTDEGLRNVWRMVDAASHPDNYRYVGRVTFPILRKFREGVFATSACIASPIGQAIMKEKNDPYALLNQYLEVFGDNFYIELHTYPGEEHEYLNSCLVQMGQEKGVPFVYATDAHFASPEQYETHDAYVAMTSGDSIYTSPEDRKMWHPQVLYIQTEEEIRANLSYLPESVVDEAIANSALIAEKCNARLPGVKRHLAPFFPSECPWLTKDDKRREMSAAELFLELVAVGITERYGLDNDEAWDRAYRECEVFLSADTGLTGGLTHYFLQAWDMCEFCNATNIQRGPGRGSAAGSIVAYALGITDVDPLHYGLIFERFWNAGRAKGFPDIDQDFPKADRKKVRDYLKDRWGHDRVRTIGTITRLKPKAACDKTWKVAEVTWEEKEALKKIIDGVPDIDILGPDSIGWAAESDPGKTIYVMRSVGQEIIEWVTSLEDDRQGVVLRWIELVEAACSRVSGYGVHPSGVVVSDVDLCDELPCMYNRSQEERVTCFPMGDVDKRMFVKHDLLGLRNLDTLSDWDDQIIAAFEGADEETRQDILKKMTVLQRLEKKHGIRWSGLDKLTHPIEMWQMLWAKLSRGVFQIEDGYAAWLAQELRPQSIEHLSALVALNRPGPIRSGAPDSFITRSRGGVDDEFDGRNIPILAENLGGTYGWFLYQEQIIRFFSDLGYDLGDADAVRKMLGKKSPEEMQRLIHGEGEWEGKGYLEVAGKLLGESLAKQIINIIADFAKYSFNKAHAVAYAIIAFRTLYAKYYYPAEFIMASIRTIGDDPKKAAKTAGFIGEGRRMGIAVLTPDVLESEADIAVKGSHIYFGLSNVKGVGKGAARYVRELSHLYDVTTPEALTDALEAEEGAWKEARDVAKESGTSFKKKSPKQTLRSNQIAALYQAGAFDNYTDRDVTLLEKQKLEKELLSVILSDDCARVFARNGDEIDAYLRGDEPEDGYLLLEDQPEAGLQVSVPGVISAIEEKTTKRDGKAMGIVTIEWEGHECEFVVFPNDWRSYRFLWNERTPGCFTVRKTERGVSFVDAIKLD